MTLEQFKYWLEGFCQGKLTENELKQIMVKLAEIQIPKIVDYNPLPTPISNPVIWGYEVGKVKYEPSSETRTQIQ